MKYINVNILGLGAYKPSNTVDNQFYLKEFEEIADDLDRMFKITCKDKRGVINNQEENALTMALEASTRALESSGICPEQLDMIVFTSDTPEYISPSNALIISNKLEAKNAQVTYDINANCLGMLVALDQVSCIMKSKKNIKYALVVSGIYASSIARKDCVITYPMVGDAATAVILEKSEEDVQRGFIDAKYKVMSEYYENSLSPACGMSKARKDSVNEYDRKMNWTPFDMNFCPDIWVGMINEFSEEYGFKIDDIEYFFLSQLTLNYAQKTAKLLGIDNYEEKFPYIGDVYGYTGATSPILALHKTLQEGIEEGSIVIFASVGTGLILNSILYKF